jgi:hypothetical protein
MRAVRLRCACPTATRRKNSGPICLELTREACVIAGPYIEPKRFTRILPERLAPCGIWAISRELW